MSLPSIFFQEVEDPILRKSLQNLVYFLRKESPLLGFKFYEITFTEAVTNFKYPHRLGFQPKDIIQTSKTGAGSITYNYSSFDSTNLDLTTTDACVIRFFAGTYQEGVA